MNKRPLCQYNQQNIPPSPFSNVILNRNTECVYGTVTLQWVLVMKADVKIYCLRYYLIYPVISKYMTLVLDISIF